MQASNDVLGPGLPPVHVRFGLIRPNRCTWWCFYSPRTMNCKLWRGEKIPLRTKGGETARFGGEVPNCLKKVGQRLFAAPPCDHKASLGVTVGRSCRRTKHNTLWFGHHPMMKRIISPPPETSAINQLLGGRDRAAESHPHIAQN